MPRFGQAARKIETGEEIGQMLAELCIAMGGADLRQKGADG